jgi:transketolase N-terminal domain/subunit
MHQPKVDNLIATIDLNGKNKLTERQTVLNMGSIRASSLWIGTYRLGKDGNNISAIITGILLMPNQELEKESPFVFSYRNGQRWPIL